MREIYDTEKHEESAENASQSWISINEMLCLQRDPNRFLICSTDCLPALLAKIYELK